jgi:hypothetical protein
LVEARQQVKIRAGFVRGGAVMLFCAKTSSLDDRSVSAAIAAYP